MTTESLSITIEGEVLTVEIGTVAAPVSGGGGGSAAWGDITGTLSAQTDLQSALDAKAPLASPALTGTPAAPTAAGATSTTQIATTAFVGGEITTHSAATDPHGDRSFATSAVSTHNGVTTAHGISAFGATLVDDADASTARTTLGLGTAATSATGDFAAASHSHAASAITSGTLAHERGGLEADVSAYSGLVKITAGATSAVTVTAAGEALLDDADASAQRTTLGLGTAATTDASAYATAAQGTDDRTASGLRETSGPTLLTLGAVADGEYLVRSGTTVVGGTPAGGGAGTDTFLVRDPTQNQPPATAFATLDTRNSIPCLDFDAAADESAIFSGVAPEAIVLTSGIIARIVWAATSATSGNVRWRVAFERRTTDQDADSFDTAAEATDAANATSGICEVCEITCTTIDSIVAGDSFRVRVTRVGTDGTNDTMTGDAELFGLELRAA